MKRQQRRKQSWTKWRKLISQQAKSGQSVAAFCRERGLCAPHFFQWKKRLSEVAAGKFVEVNVSPVTAKTHPAASAGIEIRLRGDRSLVVEPGFDATHLEVLLDMLENRS
jgi:hypothetical protein